jgi:hypothetical protein
MTSGFQRALIVTFAALASIVFAPAAQAASAACYNDSEFEADRGLRLHSDIEVIMLTCRYSTTGEDLRKVYAKFLQANVKTIKGWENVIARTYAGTGGSRNEVIDNFRTKLANQKGNEAAKMGPKPFCKEWADYVPFIASLNAKQIMDYVREPDTTRPTRRERCKT